MNDHPTLPDLLDEAIAAEEALAALSESVDDEWSYINDLRQAWIDRLSDAAAELDPSVAAAPAIVEAVRLAIDEAGLIRDPHRAIDWLSTLPQVVLIAVEG